MKKAKTNNKILAILSAILGAVFALIIGVTYCASSLTLIYSSNPQSTTAYLGNQQYHITNDTLLKPVTFGEGAKNFEIALHYAFDYDFDVRLSFNMQWSTGVQLANGSISKYATNAIPTFANRDNIIFDEQYIYLTNSVPAGNGKITIMTGVEFVDPTDSKYVGQTLTINITDVKIYKKQASYALNTHMLTKDATTSAAAQAWIYSKNKATSSTAYVMMYNYRRNYDSGIPYPGLETAYKKPSDSSNKVTGATWTGGNRSYAGVAMYVITGTTAAKLEVQVAGIWRSSEGATSLISENSVLYNYSSGWSHSSWDDQKLWETRTYNYVIPANTACYIEIVDSIEIISAERVTSNLDFDEYRLVTNSIMINPSLYSETAANDKSTVFSYSEEGGWTKLAEVKPINLNSTLSIATSTNYSQSDVDVLNTSVYNNGLYTSIAGSAKEQTFNTNISLINNTAETKTVDVAYQLKYRISNGQTTLIGVVGNGSVNKRAEEHVADGTLTAETAFKGNLYYSETKTTSQLTSAMVQTVTVAPYSSINLVERYKVAAALQAEIANLYDPQAADSEGNKYQADGYTDYYDVWTFLDVAVTPKTVTTTPNLSIETTKNGNLVTVSVKNNTTSSVKGVTIKNFGVEELGNVSYSAVTGSTAPLDWEASFWKYYTYEDGVYSQVKVNPITATNPFQSGKYYLKSQTYTPRTITALNSFEVDDEDDTIYTHSSIIILPGETVAFASVTTSATGGVMVTGYATSSVASAADEKPVKLIDGGTAQAYIVNTSTTSSYYIRFSGAYSGTDTTHIQALTASHNYYIGILRPGQILNIPMSADGEVEYIAATGNFSASAVSSWNVSAYTNLMNKLFALTKA